MNTDSGKKKIAKIDFHPKLFENDFGKKLVNTCFRAVRDYP